MTLQHFALDEHGEPRPVNFMEWAMFFEKRDRIVKQEQVGRYWVSTVFLGIDHGWDSPTPVLWESMVFASIGNLSEDQYQGRCSGNREQAYAMHCDTVALVKDTEETWDSYINWNELSWLFSWLREQPLLRTLHRFRSRLALSRIVRNLKK